FFQAEDGIRDYKVTGVQTCALPISNCASVWTSPGGLTDFSCHWMSRMVLVSVPSFSAAGAAGTKNTSVLTSLGLVPGAFHTSAVSVLKMSTTTSQSSFCMAARASLAFGPPTA